VTALDLSNSDNLTTKDYNLECPCSECHWTCPVDNQKSLKTIVMLTVFEVVLGTAIIMALSALVTILLKICSRPRLSRNAQEDPNNPDELGRNGVRVSLTSLQQRVMTKLRDRPPRYETRHNYEYQRREGITRISVLNPGATSMAADMPPPTYEASDSNTTHELPPAYTIAIEDSGGILNPSFSSNEITAIDSRANTISENDIITSNRTCVLHI